MKLSVIAWLALGLMTILLGATFVLTQPSVRQFLGMADDPCAGGVVAGGSIGGPFTLMDGSGATVTENDVITKPSLVYFGYTFCPDVCPFDMSRNVEAVDLLAEQGYDVTPVFITIDPARDDVQAVGDFAANHHEKAVGLTGNAQQIKQAADAYRVYYKAQKAEDGDDFYLVDHSVFTYLMDPERGFLDFFRRDATPEQVARRTACFLSQR